MTIPWDLPPGSPEQVRPEGLAQLGAPSPPPGPGVRTPFAVPPTERDPRRLWLSLGIGAALLVLCCGGGAVGIGALAVAQTHALRQEATTIVGHYLDGLHNRDYRTSYGLLCAQLRHRMTLDGYTGMQARRPQVLSYVLDPPQLAGQDVTVDASVTVEGGTLDHRAFELTADSDTGQLRICQGE